MLLLFYITVDDISVMYVTAHKSAVSTESMFVESEKDNLYSKILESTNIWRLNISRGHSLFHKIKYIVLNMRKRLNTTYLD